jgi:membrane protease YdiL (CAAX protease family)
MEGVDVLLSGVRDAAASAIPAVIDVTPSNTIPAVDSALQWWPVVAVFVMILMVNVAANKALPNLYMFWALGGSVVVLALGIMDGCTWRDLGLSPGTWASGLIWGLGAIALVYAVYEIGSHLPRIRQAFNDTSITGLPRWKVYFKALVELPFGTVLFEEIAFRGVLWAMLARRIDWIPATIVTAVLFGFWHILGSLDLHERNPGLAVGNRPRVSQILAVSGAVLNTAIGGLIFTGLRVVSGSLFAPMGFHWATNGWGYLFARRFRIDGNQ